MTNKGKYIKIVFGILLVAGLVAGVILVRQTQELRRGAFFASKKLELLPSENTKNIGDELLVHLQVSGVGSTGAKVDNIRSVVCYNSTLVDIDPTLPNIRQSVTINNPSNSIFDHKYLVNVYDIIPRNIIAPTSGGQPTPIASPSADMAINKCVDFTIGTEKSLVNLKNDGEFAIVHLKAKAIGSGIVRILKESTKVSGDNITDPSVQVDSVGDLAYTIVGAGTGPVLNFKVAFNFLRPGAECADWGVQVKVNGSDGSSRTYDDVSLTRTADTNPSGYAVYSGTVRLTGFTQTNNVAVFIKGPKHLATKYGVDLQENFYNQLEGQLDGLTNNPATSPTFDFSKYPLLAGDVTSQGTSGVQDGVINGIDFSFVKSNTEKRTSERGANFLADLNGDCVLGSVDTGILTQSLIDKQEQTY